MIQQYFLSNHRVQTSDVFNFHTPYSIQPLLEANIGACGAHAEDAYQRKKNILEQNGATNMCGKDQIPPQQSDEVESGGLCSRWRG